MEVEGFFRKILEKMGGRLDSSLGASDEDLQSVAMKFAAQAQRAIEEGVRSDAVGLRAPHLITLALPFQLHSQLGDALRADLAESVRTVAESFIRDRRYATAGPVAVQVMSDVFRDAPAVQVGFGDAPAAPLQVKTLRVCNARGAELFSAPLHRTCTVQIGRSRDNALTLSDESVSRFHATLTATPDGELTVQDLGSANGTYVREKKTPISGSAHVASGDSVFFGDLQVIPRVE